MFGWRITIWRRRPWTTPRGFSTFLSRRGDPALDQPGAREDLYRDVFSTFDGRRVLADILARSGIGAAFDPDAGADAGFHNSGMQAMAIDIARLAGLESGALGRALVSGQLEAMNDEAVAVEED